MVDNCSTTARLGARKWAPRFDYTLMEEVVPGGRRGRRARRDADDPLRGPPDPRDPRRLRRAAARRSTSSSSSRVVYAAAVTLQARRMRVRVPRRLRSGLEPPPPRVRLRGQQRLAAHALRRAVLREVGPLRAPPARRRPSAPRPRTTCARSPSTTPAPALQRLVAARYPRLARVEGWMRRTYGWLGRTRSQRFNLAFAAGSETIAFTLARWTEEHLGELFTGADPVPTTLFLWHLAEEVEHKSAAFDVYEAIDGSRLRYAFATTPRSPSLLAHVVRHDRDAGGRAAGLLPGHVFPARAVVDQLRLRDPAHPARLGPPRPPPRRWSTRCTCHHGSPTSTRRPARSRCGRSRGMTGPFPETTPT